VSSVDRDVADLSVGCVIGIVWVPLGILIWSFVLMKTWNWWAPAAFGFQAITFKQTVAVIVIKAVLLHKTDTSPTDKSKTVTETAITSVALSAIAAAMLFVVSWLTYVILY
jgi:uncharacterized membrane protein